MDALPVYEKTGLPYASLREGVMHACGHVIHIFIGLGVAKLLSTYENERTHDTFDTYEEAMNFINSQSSS